MRKLFLLFPFLLDVSISNAQKKYRCEFAETITSVMPDSVFRNYASKNNLSAKEIEQFLEQAVLGFQLIQRGIITTTIKAMLVKLQQRL